jgi:hypothetical protein
MKNYLFNFSASYTGGGYKRLYAYSKWFNDNGGAVFIINIRNSQIISEHANNKYYIVNPKLYQRIFNDCSYLPQVLHENVKFDVYYSYGIPINKKIANINWFHLSNVLPFVPFKIPMTFFNRLKFIYLGVKIKNGLKYSDVISAESKFSLSLINSKFEKKLFLSVNGSDDEISFLNENSIHGKEQMALVIGTQWYKSIPDAYILFKSLQIKEPLLKLYIIGKDNLISKKIKKDQDVYIINKFLDRILLLDYLRKCKYYITTTRIENSYNASSEGIYFADESLISDIDPHRELLENVKYERIAIPKSKRSVLHIYRKNINGSVLKSWNEIIIDMINHINHSLK